MSSLMISLGEPLCQGVRGDNLYCKNNVPAICPSKLGAEAQGGRRRARSPPQSKKWGQVPGKLSLPVFPLIVLLFRLPDQSPTQFEWKGES